MTQEGAKVLAESYGLDSLRFRSALQDDRISNWLAGICVLGFTLKLY